MSIGLARQLAVALDVKSESKIRLMNRALLAYVRLTQQSEVTASPGNIDASQVTSGTFADARIAESNVTQHEDALEIDGMQIVGTIADGQLSSNVPLLDVENDWSADFVMRGTHATLTTIRRGNTAGELRLNSGTSNSFSSGSRVNLFGVSHATRAGEVDIIAAGGKITIGGGKVNFTAQIGGDGFHTETLSAQVDNLDVSGASTLLVNAVGNQDLTGIAGGEDGRWLFVSNIDGTDTVTLKHDSASSSSANRIFGPGSADIALPPRGGCLLRYASSRWRTVATGL